MSGLDSNIKETLESETLEALAEKIARYATQADERTLEAAKLIREARKRAEAEDPQEELKRQRKLTQVRVENHREKKKSAALRNGGKSLTETAEIEEDRKSPIAWARSAPIDRVTEVLSYARQVDSADASSRSDEPAETVAA